MRCAACVAVLTGLLAVAAPASIERAATFEAAFTPNTSASVAAVDLHMTWADPGEPGGKPQALHLLRIQFAPGTKIDTAALPRCRATDKRIAKLGPSACPRRTRLGTGVSVLTSGQQQLTTNIVLINARRQIVVVVRVGKSTLAVYRDDVRGATVTVHFELPPSLSLLDLRIRIPIHVHRRHVYFHTPPACPASGGWPTTATSTYADGAVQQVLTSAACTS